MSEPGRRAVAVHGEGGSTLRLSIAARTTVLLDADGLFTRAHNNSANFAVAHAASDSPRAFLARHEDIGETF